MLHELSITSLQVDNVQGVQTCVGGYDLINGIRMGRVDIRTPAVALLFSRDGSLLVVATQVRHRMCCRGILPW